MPTVRAYGRTDDAVVDRVRTRLEADELTPTRIVVDVEIGFVEVELPGDVDPLVESSVLKSLVEELPPPPATPEVTLERRVAELEARVEDLTTRVIVLEGPRIITDPTI